MLTCSCKKNFKSHILFTEHIAKCFVGKKYKCYKCGFICPYTEEAEALHKSKCMTPPSSERSFEDLKQENETLKQNLMLLSIQLDKERMQTRLYKQLLKDNTKIKIKDVIEDKDDGIYFPKYMEEGKLNYIINNVKSKPQKRKPPTRVIVVESESEAEGTCKLKKSTRRNAKGETYRSIKNMNTVEEKGSEELFSIMNQVDTRIQSELDTQFGDIFVERAQKNINEIIDLIKKNEGFENRIKSLSKNRMRLLRHMTIESYIEICTQHLGIIANVLKNNKHDEKSIIKYTNASMNSIEKRLMLYNKYYNTTIDVDDLHRVKCAMFNNIEHNKEFKPYSPDYTYMTNYMICLVPLKEFLRSIFENAYGFHSIIYLNYDKSSKEDPYTFYTLDECEQDRRLWKMDCRLENVAVNIGETLLTFCEDLFRRIYYNIFNDNEYRENFLQYSQTTICDCKQLLNTIFILCNSKKLRNLCKEIVCNFCTYTPSTRDKFDTVKDDRFQKNMLKKEYFSNEHKFVIMSRLFDNIDEAQSTSFSF
jgi:hypothetical protein